MRGRQFRFHLNSQLSILVVNYSQLSFFLLKKLLSYESKWVINKNYRAHLGRVENRDLKKAPEFVWTADSYVAYSPAPEGLYPNYEPTKITKIPETDLPAAILEPYTKSSAPEPTQLNPSTDLPEAPADELVVPEISPRNVIRKVEILIQEETARK